MSFSDPFQSVESVFFRVLLFLIAIDHGLDGSNGFSQILTFIKTLDLKPFSNPF